MTFEDGTRKVIDLEQHLAGPVFEPLKDPVYFRRVAYNADMETSRRKPSRTPSRCRCRLAGLTRSALQRR